MEPPPVSQTSLTLRTRLLIPVLLLALALRLAPWNQNRFLEDEALYAYWGLQIASGADPMLDLEPVDKPPLHPYTLALSFALLGQHETAAQLPSLFASLAGITLVYVLGRELYGDARTSMMAALLLALSPFDILFASTAFTDPLLTALAVAALLAAARGWLGAAGLLSGLAAATKQQGLLFLPLIVTVGLLSGVPSLARAHKRGRRPLDWLDSPHSSADNQSPTMSIGRRLASIWKRPWMRFALGFALVAGGMIWWDLARAQRPGFLEQSLVSYGGLAPAQADALGRRAMEWLGLLSAFWVSPLVNALFLGGFICWLVGTLLGWWAGPSKIDHALALFVAAFLLIHWLVGFQVWDRYLLGLVPLAALLAARGLVTLGDALRSISWRRAYTLAVGLVLACSLVAPVLRATRSELPLGGDHGAYDGIDELATFMRTQVPPGAVLYHHWLGYHYRFYLYGAPLHLHWYPDLQDLQRDSVIYRREPRYIAFPSWRDGTAAQASLAEVGIALVPAFSAARRDGTTSFRLYRLEGP